MSAACNISYTNSKTHKLSPNGLCTNEVAPLNSLYKDDLPDCTQAHSSPSHDNNVPPTVNNPQIDDSPVTEICFPTSDDGTSYVHESEL